MIRNQGFYLRLKELFKRSLELFVKQQDGLKKDQQFEEQPEFQPDGGVRVRTVIRQRFSISSEDAERLKGLPEFRELVSFIAGSELAQDLLIGLDNKPIDESNQSDCLFQYLFLPLFSRYNWKAESPEFQQGLFDELYRGIEDYCLCSDVVIASVAPIFGFALAPDVKLPIQLASALVVRELDAQERSRLWQGAEDSIFYDKFSMYGLRFAAELTQCVDKRNPSYLISSETFVLLEDLLRLIKRYPITIRFLKPTITPWYNNRVLVGGTLSWPRSGTIGRRFVNPALFNQEDVRLLQQFWQTWPSMKGKDTLALALRYFGSSCDKSELADRLVDLWIGLETLFSDQSQELSYRIALRISHYLGKGDTKREEIFDAVKKSYDCRSYLVHGRTRRKKANRYEGIIEAIVQQTGKYLADSIESCLGCHTLPDLVDLDRLIVRGSDNLPPRGT